MRRTTLLLSVFALVLASCGGGSEEGKPSGATTPAASASVSTAPGSPTASPTVEMRLDYPFPPWSEAVKLLDYDTSEPLGFKERDEERHKGVTVYDVEYQSSGYAVLSWLVMPDGQGLFPAVLYAHDHTNTRGRDWFLEDAIALAREGYAGLLITGPDTREPFLPLGTASAQADLKGTLLYARDLRRGLDLLETLPEIDATRIGFVGYRWGAWAGANLSSVEDRIDAYVLMSGGQGYPCTRSDASGSTCHVTDDFAFAGIDSWPTTPPDFEQYLLDTMAINTISYVNHSEGAAFLFQFGRGDERASAPTVRTLFVAAPEPKTLRWYEEGHDLGCYSTATCDADAEAYVFHRTWLQENV